MFNFLHSHSPFLHLKHNFHRRQTFMFNLSRRSITKVHGRARLSRSEHQFEHLPHSFALPAIFSCHFTAACALPLSQKQAQLEFSLALFNGWLFTLTSAARTLADCLAIIKNKTLRGELPDKRSYSCRPCGGRNSSSVQSQSCACLVVWS